MQGYEEIEIIGNVGNDPEMRYTPTGVPVTSFTVAVNKVWTDANGQKQEKTKWFRVTCWRKLAEITAQYVTKGKPVFVKGEIEASAFTDKSGNNRASLELTATTVKFLGGRDDVDGGSDAGGYTNGSGSGNRGGQAAGAAYTPPLDADIPF